VSASPLILPGEGECFGAGVSGVSGGTRVPPPLCARVAFWSSPVVWSLTWI